MKTTRNQLMTSVLFAAAAAIDAPIKGGGAAKSDAPKEPAKPEKKTGPVLIHTRDEADQKTLLDNIDINTLGSEVEYVHGLLPESQVNLLMAAKLGTRIVTTGMPLDIASKVGEVTVARAWDVTKTDGTRSRGCQPPQQYFAGRVYDQAAFDALKNSEAFKKVFTAAPEPKEAAI